MLDPRAGAQEAKLSKGALAMRGATTTGPTGAADSVAAVVIGLVDAGLTKAAAGILTAVASAAIASADDGLAEAEQADLAKATLTAGVASAGTGVALTLATARTAHFVVATLAVVTAILVSMVRGGGAAGRVAAIGSAFWVLHASATAVNRGGVHGLTGVGTVVDMVAEAVVACVGPLITGRAVLRATATAPVAAPQLRFSCKGNSEDGC